MVTFLGIFLGEVRFWRLLHNQRLASFTVERTRTSFCRVHIRLGNDAPSGLGKSAAAGGRVPFAAVGPVAFPCGKIVETDWRILSATFPLSLKTTTVCRNVRLIVLDSAVGLNQA